MQLRKTEEEKKEGILLRGQRRLPFAAARAAAITARLLLSLVAVKLKCCVQS